MTSKEPVDFFRLFFTPELIDIIFSETTRYAEQQLADNDHYLNAHPHARGHDWLKHPMEREEVEPLLAIFLTMGILGFPTLRYGSKIKKIISHHSISHNIQVVLEHQMAFFQ